MLKVIAFAIVNSSKHKQAITMSPEKKATLIAQLEFMNKPLAEQKAINKAIREENAKQRKISDLLNKKAIADSLTAEFSGADIEALKAKHNEDYKQANLNLRGACRNTKHTYRYKASTAIHELKRIAMYEAILEQPTAEVA